MCEMKTDVIVQLSGGSWQRLIFATRSDALDFIESWVNACKQGMKDGNLQATISGVWPSNSIIAGEEDRIAAAVLGQCVIGMWIPDNTPTAPERIAAVLEKSVKDGDEWKCE